MTEPTLPPEPAKDATADELEADIAATRQQLGETIDALEEKLDVSAQAKRKVDQTKSQLADKVNATKARVSDKVTAVRTQVTDKVGNTKAQVSDKVNQTQAKMTGKYGGATTEPVTETVYPAESQETGSSPGSSQVTSPNEAGRTKAAVTDKVKNITTRLASKVTEARTGTKAAGSEAGARRAQVVDGTGSDVAAGATASTRPQFTSTAAAVTGKVGQTKANLTGKASQFAARTRENPRSAWPAAGAVLAGVVVSWLAWRAARRADPVSERE